MINVQLNLIIPIFIPESNTYNILSTVDYDIQYPVADIEAHQDIDEIILMILNRYLKESSGVISKLTDVSVDGTYINIYYLCYVNYETTISNGVLKNIDVIAHKYPPNASKILSLLKK